MLDDPDPAMPKGVLGAGEVGITGVGAAVANAVFDATGARVTDLPITLDKVLRGIPLGLTAPAPPELDCQSGVSTAVPPPAKGSTGSQARC